MDAIIVLVNNNLTTAYLNTKKNIFSATKFL